MSDPPANRALRERITHWVAQGYRVVAETPTSAQLVRPRRFNPVEFIAMPIYVLEYLGQRDHTVYSVDRRRRLGLGDWHGTGALAHQRAQDAPAWRRLLWHSRRFGDALAWVFSKNERRDGSVREGSAGRVAVGLH